MTLYNQIHNVSEDYTFIIGTDELFLGKQDIASIFTYQFTGSGSDSWRTIRPADTDFDSIYSRIKTTITLNPNPNILDSDEDFSNLLPARNNVFNKIFEIYSIPRVSNISSCSVILADEDHIDDITIDDLPDGVYVSSFNIDGKATFSAIPVGEYYIVVRTPETLYKTAQVLSLNNNLPIKMHINDDNVLVAESKYTNDVAYIGISTKTQIGFPDMDEGKYFAIADIGNNLFAYIPIKSMILSSNVKMPEDITQYAPSDAEYLSAKQTNLLIDAGGGGGGIIIDPELNPDSVHPVQNKAITNAINAKADKDHAHGHISQDGKINDMTETVRNVLVTDSNDEIGVSSQLPFNKLNITLDNLTDLGVARNTLATVTRDGLMSASDKAFIESSGGSMDCEIRYIEGNNEEFIMGDNMSVNVIVTNSLGNGVPYIDVNLNLNIGTSHIIKGSGTTNSEGKAEIIATCDQRGLCDYSISGNGFKTKHFYIYVDNWEYVSGSSSSTYSVLKNNNWGRFYCKEYSGRLFEADKWTQFGGSAYAIDALPQHETSGIGVATILQSTGSTIRAPFYVRVSVGGYIWIRPTMTIGVADTMNVDMTWPLRRTQIG